MRTSGNTTKRTTLFAADAMALLVWRGGWAETTALPANDYHPSFAAAAKDDGVIEMEGAMWMVKFITPSA